MKLVVKPRTNVEKFGFKVYAALVDNFAQTFFVGGTVRDWLLRRRSKDIDIATTALPQEVQKVLRQDQIEFHLKHLRFGVITAFQGPDKVQIATFRKDLPGLNRYPEVRFVKSAKADSQRRDFTTNALYFNPKIGVVFDFHDGLLDLRKRRLRFIGNPQKRMQEDPLRIIRALRFQIQLHFSLEQKTALAIKNNFHLIKKLSATRIATEINKLKSVAQQKALQKIINSLPLDEK